MTRSATFARRKMKDDLSDIDITPFHHDFPSFSSFIQKMLLYENYVLLPFTHQQKNSMQCTYFEYSVTRFSILKENEDVTVSLILYMHFLPFLPSTFSSAF